MQKAPTAILRADNAVAHRVLPFGLFMLFIALEAGARIAADRGFLSVPTAAPLYLYPLKAVAVGALLLKFRTLYDEVSFRELKSPYSAAVIAAGIGTCALWVSMSWTLPVNGSPPGYDPTLLPAGAVRYLMTACRIAGAVLVVPIMEELFWRSFLLRYLINPDFRSVPLGEFTWPSFLITTFLFGLEHHLFFAGLMAGAIYNAILYKTRSLAQCTLAHAVTNLTLAGYVLYTGEWYFW